jgi:hypothetical protein
MPPLFELVLVKVTEARRGQGEDREHRGVVVRDPPITAMLRITKAVTLFQEFAGGDELPEQYVTPPHAATPQFRADVVPPSIDLLEGLLGIGGCPTLKDQFGVHEQS